MDLSLLGTSHRCHVAFIVNQLAALSDALDFARSEERKSRAAQKKRVKGTFARYQAEKGTKFEGSHITLLSKGLRTLALLIRD